VWLEIPSEGQDLRRCEFVNHPRHLAAVGVPQDAASLTGQPPGRAKRIPAQLCPQETSGGRQQIRSRKEASLVIGHEKAMSGA